MNGKVSKSKIFNYKASQNKMLKTEVHVRPGNITPLVIGDKVFKSSNDFELTEGDIEEARVAIGETEEKKERCLLELMKKLSGDKSVSYRTDDSYLLRFLRSRKYDTEKAYQNLKKFYDIRKKHPDLFNIPSDFISALDTNFLTYLPYTDEEGRIMFYSTLDKWNPEETSFESVYQSLTAVCDVISMNPKCQIKGIIAIWDTSGISRSQLIEFLRKNRILTNIALMTNGYPWRVKKVVVINTGLIVRMLYSIVLPFVSKKVAERIILLGSDMDELHKHVNPALLPKKLGGALEDEECRVGQHIMDNLPYLRYERSFV